MNLTHLLIDFDNTLMDTETHSVPPLIERFNALYGSEIETPLTLTGFKENFHGMSGDALCERLNQFYNIKVDQAKLYQDREKLMQARYQDLPNGITMAPNAIETLTWCRQNGLTLAVVTNNPLQRAFAAMRCAANKQGATLAACFQDYYFEANPIRKPNPDVYQRAMSQMNVNVAHAAAIEDSVTGATSATGAGLTTWGYVGLSKEPEALKQKLLQHGCQQVFDDWAAILAFIKSQ